MKLPHHLYLLGIFFLPIEALPISISKGWNAVALLFFLADTFLILFFHPRAISKVFARADPKSQKNLLILLVFCLGLSLFSYLISGEISLSGLARGTITLVLGLSFFFSTAYHLLVGRLSSDVLLSVLFSSYFFALLVGVLQFFNVNIPFIDLIAENSRRGGRVGIERVTFMFSEPSFVAVHLSGVLLPFFLLLARRRSQILIGSFLILSFVGINLISGSSLRLLFEFGVISAFLFFQFGVGSIQSFLRKIFLSSSFLFVAFSLLFFGVFYSFVTVVLFPHLSNDGGFLLQVFDNFSYLQDRMLQVLNFSEGVSDYSASIRRLRVDLVVRTLSICPSIPMLTSSIGVGFANLPSLTGQACADVFAPYRQILAYNPEYLELVSDSAVRTVFSMPARILGEFGIIGFISFVYILFPRTFEQRIIASSVIVSLIGFDSYAFYGIWIYVFSYLFPPHRRLDV